MAESPRNKASSRKEGRSGSPSRGTRPPDDAAFQRANCTLQRRRGAAAAALVAQSVPASALFLSSSSSSAERYRRPHAHLQPPDTRAPSVPAAATGLRRSARAQYPQVSSRADADLVNRWLNDSAVRRGCGELRQGKWTKVVRSESCVTDARKIVTLLKRARRRSWDVLLELLVEKCHRQSCAAQKRSEPESCVPGFDVDVWQKLVIILKISFDCYGIFSCS